MLFRSKNSKIFEDYIFNDMSLAEIAQEQGITRQGVRDIVKRSGEKLANYEHKLGLIARFDQTKETISFIKNETIKMKNYQDDKMRMNQLQGYLEVVGHMTDNILEEL